MAAAQNKNPSPPNLLEQPIIKQVEVLLDRGAGLYECDVPTRLVGDLHVPVDHGKFTSLREDFIRTRELNGGTGQKTPTRIGYVEGESEFRIVDGFHRDAVIRDLGIRVTFSTVEMMTLEQLLDERIRSATTHENVKFARTAEWMGEAWSLHPLSEKVPLTAVLGFARPGGKAPDRYELTPEEIESGTEWAHAKAGIWNSKVTTLHRTLTIANAVDPELVHNARPAKATATPKTIPITPQTAEVLSVRLPNRHSHQKLVAKATAANSLPSAEVERLAAEVAEMTAQQAGRYVRGIDWDSRRKTETARTYGYSEKDMLRTGAVRGSSAVEPLLEITDATAAAIRETDLGGLSSSRLERIRRDLVRVHERIAGMIAIVGAEQDPETSAEYETNVGFETIDGFLGALGTSLEDGKFPTIKNDEQVGIIEDLLVDPDVATTLTDSVRSKLRRHLRNYQNRKE